MSRFVISRSHFVWGSAILAAISSSLLPAQVPSSEEARQMTQEQIVAAIRAEHAKALHSTDHEWNDLSEDERERRRARVALALAELAEGEAMMRAQMSLPLEERDRFLEETHAERAARRDFYRRAREALDGSAATGGSRPSRLMPPLPPEAIDKWVFLSVVEVGGGTEVSLGNPWERLSFWAKIGEERYGIEILEWHPHEKTLMIRAGDQSRILTMGGDAMVPNPGENDRRATQNQRLVEFEEKWKRAVEESDELRTLDNSFQAIVFRMRENAEETRALRRSAPSNPVERVRGIRELQEEANDVRTEGIRLLTRVFRALEEHPHFTAEDIQYARRLFDARMVQRPE